jgi:hypothetical protein
VVFEAGQFATILATVGANTRVSVVTPMAVEKRDGCCFVPIADQGTCRRLGVVQFKQHFHSPALRIFSSIRFQMNALEPLDSLRRQDENLCLPESGAATGFRHE